MTTHSDLVRRLPGKSSDYVDAVAHFINTYKLDVDISNFFGGNFNGTDMIGKNYELIEATQRDRYVHLGRHSKDVLVLLDSPAILGWVSRKKVKDLGEDRYTATLSSLQPLPIKGLQFQEKCMHLGRHGGYKMDNHWVCFGCNAELIFNEKVLVPVGRNR